MGKMEENVESCAVASDETATVVIKDARRMVAVDGGGSG